MKLLRYEKQKNRPLTRSLSCYVNVQPLTPLCFPLSRLLRGKTNQLETTPGRWLWVLFCCERGTLPEISRTVCEVDVPADTEKRDVSFAADA